MFCSNCGTQNSDEAVFCKNCGFSLEEGMVKDAENKEPDPQPAPSPEPAPSTYAQSPANPPAPRTEGYQRQPQNGAPAPLNQNESKPIGMWGYFGYQILFGIPLIGFIFLLVFAFGGTKNINVRNFARSYFCVFILWIVLFLVFILIGPGRELFNMLLYNLRYL